MNRNVEAKKSERGQAIVLIILSIVGLFGFAALALDMGQVYLARRSAQTAADAAAMAAADDAATGSKKSAVAIGKAFTIASVNGYNNDGVTNTVIVNNPPVGGPYCGICGSPQAREYYQVKITVFTKPIFAQLFFSGAEQNTVEAIAHVRSAGPFSGDDALVSLSTVDDSMEFDGKVAVTVEDGNIRSYGGIKTSGASGSISTPTRSYGAYYATTPPNKPDIFHPAYPRLQAAPGLPSFYAPYCPSAAETDTWVTVDGAKYKNLNGTDYYYHSSALSSNKGVETLPKGIHCINGGIGKGNWTGTDVLIVLLSGGIQQTGGDSINFSTASDLKDAYGNQFGGMVFFVPKSNTSTLKFGGNTDAQINGTFYAPGAFCDIGGTPGVTNHASIICDKIKIHGNPELKITYDSASLFHTSASVELTQ